MKKALKILGWVVLVFMICIILIPLFLKNKVDGIIKKEFESSLNAKLDFSKLSISLIRNFPNASVRVSDAVVTGVGVFEGDTLAAVNKLNLTVNLGSLFGNEGIEIKTIEIDRPYINAVQLADGRANWDIMKEDAAGGGVVAEEVSEPSSLKLQLKDVKVANGAVFFRADSSAMAFSAEGIDFGIKGNMASDAANMKLTASMARVNYTMGKVKFVNNATFDADVEFHADFTANKIDLKDNVFKINNIELGLDGWITSLEDGMLMDLKLNSEKVEFKDILSMIPAFYMKDFESLSAEGQLALEAVARGRMKEGVLPFLDVKISVDNGVIRYENLPKNIYNVFLNAGIYNPGGDADLTEISVTRLSFMIAKQKFDSSFSAKTPVSDLDFTVMANGILDLGAIKDVYPLGDSVALSGVAELDVRLAGKMSDIEKENYQNLRGSGSFTIEGLTFNSPDIPTVNINTISASITPASMRLGKLDVAVGVSDIKASGSLDNYMAYFFNKGTLSGRLSVNSNLLDLNELMSYSGQESEEISAAADTSTMSVFEVPENINLAVDASAGKILFQKMVMTNVKGAMAVAGGKVSLNRFDLNAFGGSLRTSGYYSTVADKKSPELALDVSLVGASFSRTFDELEAVQKLVPLFETTGGDYSLTMKMDVRLDEHMEPLLNTLDAEGVLSSANIHLQNIKAFDVLAEALNYDRLKNVEAKDVSIPFIISQGRVSTSPFDLKVAGANVNLSGTTGLDQTIDYTAKVTLPAGTAGGYLSNVNVMIKGTFSDPKVEVGVKEMVEDAVKQVIQQEIIGKITGNPDANLSEEIAKQSENLRKEAKAAGDKLVAAAKEQGKKIEDNASEGLAKAAAKVSSAALVKEAEKAAQKLMDEAEKAIEKLNTQKEE